MKYCVVIKDTEEKEVNFNFIDTNNHLIIKIIKACNFNCKPCCDCYSKRDNLIFLELKNENTKTVFTKNIIAKSNLVIFKNLTFGNYYLQLSYNKKIIIKKLQIIRDSPTVITFNL